MQDHFIKNVNDLSLCMTPETELGLIWKSVHFCEQQHRDDVLSVSIILIRCSCPMLCVVGSSSYFTRRDWRIKGLQAHRGHPRIGGGQWNDVKTMTLSPFSCYISDQTETPNQQTQRSGRFATRPVELQDMERGANQTQPFQAFYWLSSIICNRWIIFTCPVSPWIIIKCYRHVFLKKKKSKYPK